MMTIMMKKMAYLLVRPTSARGWFPFVVVIINNNIITTIESNSPHHSCSWRPLRCWHRVQASPSLAGFVPLLLCLLFCVSVQCKPHIGKQFSQHLKEMSIQSVVSTELEPPIWRGQNNEFEGTNYMEFEGTNRRSKKEYGIWDLTQNIFTKAKFRP